jgi:hypothetical protein
MTALNSKGEERWRKKEKKVKRRVKAFNKRASSDEFDI